MSDCPRYDRGRKGPVDPCVAQARPAIAKRRTASLLATALAACVLCLPLAATAQEPGTAVPNGTAMAQLYVSACFDAPTLAQSQAVLAGQGMVPSPSSGTYFHSYFNMSVNPSGESCSMVLAINGTSADAIATMQADLTRLVGNGASAVRMRDLDDGNGTAYISLAIPVRW